MTATETAKEKLQQRVAEKPMVQSVKHSLSEIITGDYMKKQLEMSLPVNLKNNADKYIRCYLTQVRSTPRLASCKAESVLGAMMTGAALGLEPAQAFGQFYMIPFKEECAFIIGYKGMLSLAYRAGVRKVSAHTVYEREKFQIAYGTEERLIHEPMFGEDAGAVKGYYAASLLPFGDYSFRYMTKEQMVFHKNRYSLTKNSGPWIDNFDEMALKTCIRKMFKYLPVATELSYGVSRDESIIRYDPSIKIQDTADVFSLPAEYPEEPKNQPE